MAGLASISGCGIGQVQERSVGLNVQKFEQLVRLITREVLFRSKKRWPSQISSFLLSSSIASVNAVPERTSGTYPLIRAALKVFRSLSASVSSPIFALASARIKYISPVR